ncbi:MAG: RsmE family RNA methyltransferase [Thermomicrobiales bacterium]
MTVHRFYVPDVEAGAGTVRLPTDQSRQLSKVLRSRPGDAVVLFDGAGNEYAGVLESFEDNRWSVTVSGVSRPDREPAVEITVGLSLIRNERFDMAVQKLTEIGVSGIVPILAERSMISYKDEPTWLKRRERLMRIVIEAAEQSERTTLTSIEHPQTVEQFFDGRSGQMVFALVERQSAQHLSAFEPSVGRLALMIGPEGGWTGAEIQLIEQRATGVSLGSLILRTETAAIAAASYVVLASRRRDGSGHE